MLCQVFGWLNVFHGCFFFGLVCEGFTEVVGGMTGGSGAAGSAEIAAG